MEANTPTLGTPVDRLMAIGQVLAPLTREWQEADPSDLAEVQLLTVRKLHSIASITEIGFRGDADTQLWKTNFARCMVAAERLLRTRGGDYPNACTEVRIALEVWLERIMYRDIPSLTGDKPGDIKAVTEYPQDEIFESKLKKSEEGIVNKPTDKLWSVVENGVKAYAETSKGVQQAS